MARSPAADDPRADGRRRGLAAVAIAAAAGVVAVAALLRDGGPVPVASTAPGDAALGSRLGELAADVRRLQLRVDQLDPGDARTEVLDRDRVAALLDELLAARGLGPRRARGAAAAAGQGAAGSATDAQKIAAELARLGPGARSDELWQQLRALGAVDEAVRWFEQRAAANPGSPDAQTALGAALVQQMLQTTDEAQRIAIGQRIEAQFDRALELQPDHWEARFRRAVGLSYATALSGRHAEAIAQFEQLVAQQANLPAAPEQAQTYLYLGRLYEEQGDRTRAAAIWRQGLQRHPQDPELQRQTAGR